MTSTSRRSDTGLFHVDCNAQKPGRYDQDHRFGSEDPKQAFFLVKLLEDAGWNSIRHFDSHAYRTENEAGVSSRGAFTKDGAAALKAQTFDLTATREQGYGYERLDQLTMEILLGVR